MKKVVGLSLVPVTALALATALTVPAAPPSLARTAPARSGPHECTGTPDGNQPIYRWVTLAKKRNVVTHDEIVYLAAGTEFDESASMEMTKVVSAELSASATVTASADVWLAKAETTVSASLKVFGSRTTKKKVSHHFKVLPSSHRRRIVFFDGVRYFKMRWHYRNCNARPHPDNRHGSLSSYSSAASIGDAFCPHSRYAKGSMPYVATLTAGC